MNEMDEVEEMDEVLEMDEEEEMDEVRGEMNKEEKEMDEVRGEMNKEEKEMDEVRGEMNKEEKETDEVRGEMMNKEEKEVRGEMMNKEEKEMEEVEEMEEVRQAARIYYERLPEKMKKKAANYFKTLDKNGDESVSCKELEEFLKKKGLTNHVPENLFELIDENHDGALDFMECITLYYMNEVRGINLCQQCRACLLKDYSVCVQCYSKRFGKSYNICRTCYETKSFQHNHSDFLDCNTLLRQVRNRRRSDTVRVLLKETIDVVSSCVTM